MQRVTEKRRLRWKIKPFFRWYDLWVGAYIDRDNNAIYICPLPTIGIKIEWWRPAFDVEAWNDAIDYIKSGLEAGMSIDEALKNAKEIV